MEMLTLDEAIEALRKVARQMPSVEQPKKEIYTAMPEKEFEEWLRDHGICHPNIHEPIPCSVVPLLIDDAINELPAAEPAYQWMPDACKACSNHPQNGGSGICHCTLGQIPIT